MASTYQSSACECTNAYKAFNAFSLRQMPHERQILSLMLLENSFQLSETSGWRRRRHFLEVWAWKGKQRGGRSESSCAAPLLGAVNSPSSEVWWIPRTSCLGKARVRMLNLRLSLKCNHCLTCGDQTSPLRPTAHLKELPWWDLSKRRCQEPCSRQTTAWNWDLFLWS